MTAPRPFGLDTACWLGSTLSYGSLWSKTGEFSRHMPSFGNRERDKAEKEFGDNEQKFAINLMHVRFSQDEPSAANSFLSSPVYGWLNKQRSDLSPPLTSRGWERATSQSDVK